MVNPIQQFLYTKYGYLAQEIAKKMILIEEGQRIPRVSDYAEEFSFGRGTVQEALKILENEQAIKLESRGHLGTFLIHKNQKKLLKLAGIKQIIGVMPLPYSKKYAGIATGLMNSFENMGYPLNLAFMRGSLSRMEALLDRRYDFAIVSRLAAERYISQLENCNLEIAVSFGPNSYLSGHAIFLSDASKSTIENGMKVGLDSHSIDQTDITMAECENLNVEFVELNYMHLLEVIQMKQIDAAVWSKDELVQSYPIKQIPLQTEKGKQYEKNITEAVCLIDKNNAQLRQLFMDISIHDVLDLQKKVEQNLLPPRY